MNEMIDISTLLRAFLEEQSVQTSFWDFRLASDYLQLFQFIIFLLTAVFGLVKYYRTKNFEINEKILAEVYAPLYSRIVKQEYFRHVLMSNIKFKDAPVISVIKRNEISKLDLKLQTTDLKITGSSFLERHYFIDILKSVNIGLASQKLLTLMSMYETAIYIDEGKSFKGKEGYFKNAIILTEIETDMVLEILRGYIDTYKKLGLEKSKNNKWEINEAKELVIKYEANKKDLEMFKKDYKNNPADYQ